jgi:DNA-binding NarL/FixJ family response regulator
MDVSEPSPLVLSRRERQVVALIAHGLPLCDIADLLCLARKTIDGVRQSAYDKLGIHDRVTLCRWAIQHGVDISTPLRPEPSPQASSERPEPLKPG